MKATELEKSKIYTDVIDIKVPLMFTGKLVKQFDSIIAYFEPVITNENKNWFNSTPKKIVKRFDINFGNDDIK